VETDDVVVSLEVEEVEEDDEDVVVVDDMVVEVVDEEEVVLEVDFVVDVDEEEDEVLVTLEVVEEGSAVVWAESVVVEVAFASAGSAAARAAMASSSTKRKMNDGWAFPRPRRESLIVFSFPRPPCQYVSKRIGRSPQRVNRGSWRSIAKV
jgi:hypothetical protein